MINFVELARNQGSKLGVYAFLKLGFTFRPSSLIYNPMAVTVASLMIEWGRLLRGKVSGHHQRVTDVERD